MEKIVYILLFKFLINWPKILRGGTRQSALYNLVLNAMAREDYLNLGLNVALLY